MPTPLPPLGGALHNTKEAVMGARNVAGAASTAAAATAAVAVLSSQQLAFVALQNLGTQIAAVLQRVWQGIVGLAGIRGNRRPWGRVVDAKTGDPIPGAVVQVLDHGSGRMRDTITADSRGNFASYLPTGSYEFRVAKTGWELTPKAPFVKLIGGERVYDGGPVAVDEEQLLSLVLAMRPTAEVPTRGTRAIKMVWQRVAYFLGALSWPLLAFGMVLNSIVVLVAPDALNISIEALYALLVILKILVIRRQHKAVGSVASQEDGKPLDLATVRIYNAQTNSLVATRITNGKGKFFLLVPPGVYTAIVTKEGYKQHREAHVVVRKTDTEALSFAFALQAQ